MKLELTQVLKTLDGKPLKDADSDLTVGKVISTILLNDAKAKDKMKNFVLAQKFHTEKTLEIDEADLKLVKESIESSAFTPLVTGQLLLLLQK